MFNTSFVLLLGFKCCSFQCYSYVYCITKLNIGINKDHLFLFSQTCHIDCVVQSQHVLHHQKGCLKGQKDDFHQAGDLKWHLFLTRLKNTIDFLDCRLNKQSQTGANINPPVPFYALTFLCSITGDSGLFHYAFGEERGTHVDAAGRHFLMMELDRSKNLRSPRKQGAVCFVYSLRPFFGNSVDNNVQLVCKFFEMLGRE